MHHYHYFFQFIFSASHFSTGQVSVFTSTQVFKLQQAWAIYRQPAFLIRPAEQNFQNHVVIMSRLILTSCIAQYTAKWLICIISQHLDQQTWLLPWARYHCLCFQRGAALSGHARIARSHDSTDSLVCFKEYNIEKRIL